MRWVKALSIALLTAAVLTITACDSTQYEVDRLKEKGRIVQACKDSGGWWYNTPGWGEECNYDTRNKP